ncbi:MAG: DUF2339 domain-containing protein [Candidatus Eremiobacteraeota bacterium]|nr:DUF2339 domain-containing protein [Candidatus Eremiobacteraeota bacterium]
MIIWIAVVIVFFLACTALGRVYEEKERIDRIEGALATMKKSLEKRAEPAKLREARPGKRGAGGSGSSPAVIPHGFLEERAPAPRELPAGGSVVNAPALPKEKPSAMSAVYPPPSSQSKEYTEKAPRWEMAFAGSYLNFFGILFLLIGIATYLTVTLSTCLAGGVLQCGAAVALGLVMIAGGNHLYLRNMEKFACPLVAGGFTIIFFAVCASYFRYGLISTPLLFAAIFTVVASSGLAIFRYDSKFIGATMLVTVFLAPFLMRFSFTGPGLIALYLVAINLGVAYVAYYKKWDSYLTLSFLATYGLYLHFFRSCDPLITLCFLTAIYLIYLFSNNILHFVRKTSSDYHLVISYVNPIAFAVASCFTLMRMAAPWPILIYLGMAGIHLALAVKAHGLREESHGFAEIVENNAVMGLLFLTASISFVSFLSKGTAWFSLVTGLWGIEAFALMAASFRIGSRDYRKLLRRFSYFALLLDAMQLFLVIPSMEGSADLAVTRLSVFIASAAAYFLYFRMLYAKRDLIEDEDQAAEGLVLLTAMAISGFIIIRYAPSPLALPLLSGLASLIAFAVSLGSFREYSWLFRGYGAMAAAFTAVILFYTMPVRDSVMLEPLSGFALYLASSLIFLASFALMYARKAEGGDTAGMIMRSLVVMACAAFYCAVLVYVPPSLSAAVTLALLAALSLKYQDILISLHRIAIAGMAITSLALVAGRPLSFCVGAAPHILPGGHFGALICIAGIFALSYWMLMAREDKIPCHERWMTGAIPYMVIAIVMKSFFAVSTGALSTIAWALIAMALLIYSMKKGGTDTFSSVMAPMALQSLRSYSGGDSRSRNYTTLALVIFFVTFLKSIVLDANFMIAGGRMTIAASGHIELQEVAFIAVLVAVYSMAALMVWRVYDVRNLIVTLALFIFCFQFTFVLYKLYGMLDSFQVVLSVFWSVSAFAFISYGVMMELKVFRQFGLLLLCASMLKIGFVDMAVLNAYNRVTTTIIMGVLLLITSFLYQRKRHVLSERARHGRMAAEGA